MATQSTNEEEVYKREYQRIKSLVSSAYVRQTSVSHFSLSVSDQDESVFCEELPRRVHHFYMLMLNFFLRHACVSITLLCM